MLMLFGSVIGIIVIIGVIVFFVLFGLLVFCSLCIIVVDYIYVK